MAVDAPPGMPAARGSMGGADESPVAVAVGHDGRSRKRLNVRGKMMGALDAVFFLDSC